MRDRLCAKNACGIELYVFAARRQGKQRLLPIVVDNLYEIYARGYCG